MKTNYISHIIVGVAFLFVGILTGHITSTSMNHSDMKMMHDPMEMSMADMGAMLEGKSGDDLDKAFLEGMIPHHQGAIDMAQFLVNAKHPELQKMGREIISAQQAEIDQMNAWLIEWNYKK